MQDQHFDHGNAADIEIPVYAPPSIEHMAGAVERATNMTKGIDMTALEYAELELRGATLEAVVAMVAAMRRLVDAQDPALPPAEVIAGARRVASVCAELEVQHVSVQPQVTGDPAFSGPRKVGSFAIIEQQQVDELLEGIRVIGDWINQQARAGQ